ncbi:MAG: hypothetical protein ACTHY5_09115 [Oceanisphaera sp.]|uniref:hypothetical protein n=1 Tax=Oceanisphaera sp. TaxID=1929979 RepID=UPI003F987243
MAARPKLIPRQPAWLALILVALVISLCLGQRMGLSTACAYSPNSEHSSPIEVTPSSSDSDNNTDNERCSLSEQLLHKVWSQLDPIIMAILLPLWLWLFQPQLSRYYHRYPPPLLFSGRRRHLVLCVFRE